MKLDAAMNLKFVSAKRYWLAVNLAQISLLFISLYSIKQQHPVLTSASLLALSVLSFLLKRRAQLSSRVAEQYRRWLFYSKSFGEELHAHIQMLIEVDMGSLAQSSFRATGDYYSSTGEVGWPRMVDNLQESTFYTRTLATDAANIHRGVTIAGLAGTVFLLWIQATKAGIQQQIDIAAFSHVADAFGKLLAFFVIGQFAESWFAFRDLAILADQLFRECSQLLASRKYSPLEILRQVSTYDGAL